MKESGNIRNLSHIPSSAVPLTTAEVSHPESKTFGRKRFKINLTHGYKTCPKLNPTYSLHTLFHLLSLCVLYHSYFKIYIPF